MRALMKYLLVVIDPQNDFTHKDGHYATRHGIRQIASVKSKINLLTDAKQYDKVMVRADYQPGQFIPSLPILAW
jgi:nicotinamidase-related amidase